MPINQNLVPFEIKKIDFAKFRYGMTMSRFFDSARTLIYMALLGAILLSKVHMFWLKYIMFMYSTQYDDENAIVVPKISQNDSKNISKSFMSQFSSILGPGIGLLAWMR